MFAVPTIILGSPWLFGLMVLLSVLLMFHVGRWLGRRFASEAGDGLGLMDGAVFALLGLLMAFTFSGAASRFEERRMLIVEEANAIGTARLRLDLLDPDTRSRLLPLIDSYVESRIKTLSGATGIESAIRQHEETQQLQAEIWRLATEAGRAEAALPAVNVVLLPALNDMFDIATVRMMILRMHTPAIIYLVLWVAAMLASLIAGHATAGIASRHNLHVLAFAILMSLALWVAMDFDYPRAGFVRLDDFDSILRGEILPTEAGGSQPETGRLP